MTQCTIHSWSVNSSTLHSVWNNQRSVHSWLLCVLFWLWPKSFQDCLFPGSEKDLLLCMSGCAAKRILTGLEVVPQSMEMSPGVSWQVLDPPRTTYKNFHVKAWEEGRKRWRRHPSNQEQATVLRENGGGEREQSPTFSVGKFRKQLLPEKEWVTSSITLIHGRGVHAK